MTGCNVLYHSAWYGLGPRPIELAIFRFRFYIGKYYAVTFYNIKYSRPDRIRAGVLFSIFRVRCFQACRPNWVDMLRGGGLYKSLKNSIIEQNPPLVKPRNNAPNHNRYFMEQKRNRSLINGYWNAAGLQFIPAPWLQPTNQESQTRAAAVFECWKNILLDFKNGHNWFITSVGPYGAY